MPFYRDPAWIGVIVGSFAVIIAIIVPILIYKKQKSTKSISYQVIDKTSLRETLKSLWNRSLEFRYKNKLLNDVNLIVMKIWNSGNIPVLEGDFRGDITIIFGEAKVLDFQKLNTIPKNMKKVELKKGSSEGNVILKPLLLNSKDTIELKFLIEDYKKVTVEARIVGVGKVLESKKAKAPRFIPLTITMLVASNVTASISTLIVAIMLRISILSSIALAATPLVTGLVTTFIFLYFTRKHGLQA